MHILTEFCLFGIEIIGNEDVVISLGSLLERLGSDVAPYAQAILLSINPNVFMELSKIPDEDDEFKLVILLNNFNYSNK